MTRRLPLFFLPLALVTLSACAGSQGFDRAEMQEVLRQTVDLTQQQAVPDAAERPVPKPTAPFRLGLFFTHRDFPTRHAIQRAEWLSQDKDVLLRALAPLQDQRILRESLVIADSTVSHSNLTEIRKAAARYGADLLLIVTGVGAVDRYNNRYAWLYPTIIGAYFADGTHSDALYLVRAGLWDVKSGLLLASEETEGHAQTVGPAALVDDRVTIRQAKKMALEHVGARMVEQLTRWQARP